MALYYRCPCTAILESPEDTARGRVNCPSCGKVVVIPQNAVLVTEQDIEEANAQLAAISPPEGIPEIAPMPPMSEPEPVSFEESPPPVQDEPVPVSDDLQIAPPEPVLSTEPAPFEMGPIVGMSESPAVDQEAADLFAEEVIAGAPEIAEPLPDIPEIPGPVEEQVEMPVEDLTPVPQAAPKAPIGKKPAGKKGAPKQAEEKPSGPPIHAGKRPAAAAAGSKRMGKTSSRSRRTRDMVSCPSCGEDVQKGAKVCPNCGEKIKTGGIFGKLVIFVLILILLAGGVVAAVYFAPESLPPVITDNVKMIGGQLKELGIPIPDQLAPAKTEDNNANTEKPADTTEKPADTTEKPDETVAPVEPVAPNTDVKVDIDMPGFETPKPANTDINIDIPNP